MALKHINLSDDIFVRNYLLALQTGKTLCPNCDNEKAELSHHYRMAAHKSHAYTESTLKEGILLLTEAAVSETLTNLLRLSDQRKQMVSIFPVLQYHQQYQ
jgi:uncharacterized Zn finger protein (UPF0148 family)